MKESDAVFPETISESLVRALGSLCNVTRGDEAKIPGKDGKTGYSYKYADLGDLLTGVRPILARYGLAISQSVVNEGQRVLVTTTLLHWAGDRMVTEPLALPGGSTPQAVGSAITYARRYQLMALLGVASDDDDGADAAASPYRGESVPAPQRPPKIEDPVRLEAIRVFESIRSLPASVIDDFRTWIDGRSVAVPQLIADEDWRTDVDQRVQELVALAKVIDVPLDEPEPLTFPAAAAPAEATT